MINSLDKTGIFYLDAWDVLIHHTIYGWRVTSNRNEVLFQCNPGRANSIGHCITWVKRNCPQVLVRIDPTLFTINTL